MKIQIPKKIRTEDFDSESQDMVSKIGEVYNTFADEVYQALDGRLDSENLAIQIVTISVVIDAAGKVKNPPQIKLDLGARVRGTTVINAVNQVNPTIYPTTHPFISFTATSTLLTINAVSGLQPGSQYLLTIKIE